MPVTEDIEKAARELGQTLNENPIMQRYRLAAEAAAQDENLRSLEAELAQIQTGLSAREKEGQVLSRADINHYHNLREQVRRHPLYVAREDALAEVKRSFADAAEAISGALMMDFNDLTAQE